MDDRLTFFLLGLTFACTTFRNPRNNLPVIGNEVRHRTVDYRFIDTARVLLDPPILSARRPGTRGVATRILYFADFRYFDYFRSSDW